MTVAHRLGLWLFLVTGSSLAPALGQGQPLVRVESVRGKLSTSVAVDGQPALVQSLRVPDLRRRDRVLARGELTLKGQGASGVARLKIAGGSDPRAGRGLAVDPVTGRELITLSGEGQVQPGDGQLLNLVSKLSGAGGALPLGEAKIDALVLSPGWETAWKRDRLRGAQQEVRRERVPAGEGAVVLSVPLGRLDRGDVLDVSAQLPVRARGGAVDVRATLVLSSARGARRGQRLSTTSEHRLAKGSELVLAKVGAGAVRDNLPDGAFLNVVLEVSGPAEARVALKADASSAVVDRYRRRSLKTSPPYRAGMGGYVAFRAPSLVVSKRGTVLAFVGAHVEGHQDEGNIDIVLRRSRDGGRTWKPMQVIANEGKNPCKVACPVVLPSGRILVIWCWSKYIGQDESLRTTRRVYVTSSDDDGRTWSSHREITDQVYRKGWRWYGTGPCHAIVKTRAPHRGRIVVPARHNSRTTNMFSHVIHSDDGGRTWAIGGSALAEKTTESTVVELSNGELMLSSRNQRDNSDHRVVSLSRDGGESFYRTFTEKQLVEPRGCQGSLLAHSRNRRTGKLNILFSNPRHRTERTNGTLQLSQDDGKTWTRRVRYSDAPPSFSGYSDIALINGDDIAVLFERGGVPKSKSDRYQGIDFRIVRFSELR
jgi:sialidase-1